MKLQAEGMNKKEGKRGTKERGSLLVAGERRLDGRRGKALLSSGGEKKERRRVRRERREPSAGRRRLHKSRYNVEMDQRELRTVTSAARRGLELLRAQAFPQPPFLHLLSPHSPPYPPPPLTVLRLFPPEGFPLLYAA